MPGGGCLAPFMRWDLPGFLSIENNLLFPRSFDSFFEIANLTSNPKNNLNLNFAFPEVLFSDSSEYFINIQADEIVYQSVSMKSKERYEDKIVDLSVMLNQNGQILDSILKY